jgi:hypothetical protein
VIENSDESASEFDFDNYAPTSTTNNVWNLPIKDFWLPQDDNNKDFRATTPELTHHLTQLEIFAKYPLKESPMPFGRVKILKQAMYYKTNTERCQAEGIPRYSIRFKEQQFLDFACVSDRNRPLSVDVSSYNREEQLVTVGVSSYQIPKNIASLLSLLKNRNERCQLARANRSVRVDINWLKSTSCPEIGKVIDEMVLGSKLTRVDGHNIGTANSLSLAFSGTHQRVKGFLSLPQGQKMVEYKMGKTKSADKKKPEKQAIWYNEQHQVTEQMMQFQRNLHSEHVLQYAPPPPNDSTQIVKLKWLPSKKTNCKSEEGIWHGLFVVSLGEAKGNVVLQECSLTKDWVEEEFPLAFRKECKNIASQLGTERNVKKFLYIPAGDSRETDHDLPPSDQLVTAVRVEYQQGEFDSCLRDSMSSAFHAMGFTAEAKELSLEDSLSGNSVQLVGDAVQFVRKLFRKSNLLLRKLVPFSCSVAQVSKENRSWPMVLILRASDGSDNSHAITVWNGMIFDSNCPCALTWSQRSLDWCSGTDCTCVGFSRGYRLSPANLGEIMPGSTIPIGTWVQLPSEVSEDLGWVRNFPIQRPNGQQNKGYIVAYTDGNKIESSRLDEAWVKK